MPSSIKARLAAPVAPPRGFRLFDCKVTAAPARSCHMVNMLEENTPPTAIAVISAEKTHFESGKEQRMFGNMRCILYGLPLKSNICGAPDFFGSVSGFCVTQLRTHDVLGWEDTCPLMIRKSISCETSPKESQRQQVKHSFNF